MSAEAKLWPILPREVHSMANFIMQPWHLLLAILAGAVHEEQQEVIEYLRNENQVFIVI